LRGGRAMEASDAARIFHDWAFAEGLMPDGPYSQPNTSLAELALIQPLTDQGKQILRTKQVQAVGFNASGGEVLVFTKRVAPSSKKLLALVPAAIDDVKIVYRQGIQNPIGSIPSLPHGVPAFVIRNIGAGQFYTCGSSISVGNWRDAG